MCNPTASHTVVVTACHHFDIPVSLRLGTSGQGDKGNWRGGLPFPEQISSTQVASMTDALCEPHLPYVFASLEGMGNAGFSADVHACSSCTSHVDVQGLDNSLVQLGCAQVYGTVRTNPRRNVRTDPDLFHPLLLNGPKACVQVAHKSEAPRSPADLG